MVHAHTKKVSKATSAALAPILQQQRDVKPSRSKNKTATGGTNMRSVATLVVGVIIGGGVAAIGFDWRASPAAAAGQAQSWPADSTQQAARAGEDQVGPDDSTQPLNVEGSVLETLDASRYTYLRIDLGKGKEAWAAVPKATVAVGSRVRVGGAMLMTDFNSQSLKRTFPEIYFGELQEGSASAAGNAAPGSGSPEATAPVVVGKVKPAEGDSGRTIAQILEKPAALGGKRVAVRGVVVKSTVGVLGRNWLHIRDNSAKEGSDDLTVTTTDAASVGQTVLVEGTVAQDKDFGAGYRYAVLVEDASVKVAP